MNAYYKVAQNYFRRMEGWHLYPGPREPWMWAWVVLAFAWVASLLWVFQKIPNILSWRFSLVIVLELALVFVGGWISTRKDAALFGVPSGRKVNSSDLEALRSKLLCEYLAVSPDKFLRVANEISGLIDMRKKFRGPSETDWSLVIRKIYDPDSKQRVLAVLLAGLTVLTALTLKVGDLPTIFEALEGEGVYQLLGGVLSIAAMVFIIFIGVQVLGAVLWNALIIWTAKSFKTASSDDAALRYLVRDLLLLYRPLDLEKVGQPAVTSTSQDSAADSMVSECKD